MVLRHLGLCYRLPAEKLSYRSWQWKAVTTWRRPLTVFESRVATLPMLCNKCLISNEGVENQEKHMKRWPALPYDRGWWYACARMQYTFGPSFLCWYSTLTPIRGVRNEEMAKVQLDVNRCRLTALAAVLDLGLNLSQYLRNKPLRIRDPGNLFACIGLYIIC